MEGRRKEVLAIATVFSVVFMLVMAMGLPVDRVPLEGPLGAYWVGVFLGSALAMVRSFAREQEAGALEELWMVPGDRYLVFWGKVLANWAAAAYVILVNLVAMVVFMNYPAQVFLLWLLVWGFVVAFGIALAGTFFSAMTVSARGKEVVMLLLLLPFLIPLFLAAMQSSLRLVAEGDWGAVLRWGGVVLFFDGVLAVVFTTLFEFVVGE